MKVDFHIHSSMSDGLFSPEKLIKTAYENNVEIMAFTDHEYLTVTPFLSAMAQSMQIRLIAGVEFLTHYQKRHVHILAYFEKEPGSRFLDIVHRLREERTEATYQLVDCLGNMGIAITRADINNMEFPAATRTHSHVLYRLHKAYPRLEAEGLRNIISSAFLGTKSLSDYHPPSYEEMIDLIKEEGGLPVIAHPGLLEDPIFVQKLLSLRPVGLEVYYGYWYETEQLIRGYEELAHHSAQAATGGSDYHGSFSRFGIGEINFPAGSLEGFLHTLKKYSLEGESR